MQETPVVHLMMSTTAPYLQTDLQKILSVMAQIPILK